MFNVFIIDDNLDFVKNLINVITLSTSDIQICGIATTGAEAVAALQDRNIDILLLDINIPEYNGLSILKNMTNQKLLNSVIVISSYTEYMNTLIDNPFVYAFIDKIHVFEEINNTLNSYILFNSKKNNDFLLKNEIINELEYLGYNISHVGTRYMQDIIYITIKQNLDVTCNIKKDIYPFLYQKYQKSYNNIKANINRATEIMYYECNENRLKKYFNTIYIIEKPKPKYIISIISNKINQKNLPK